MATSEYKIFINVIVIDAIIDTLCTKIVAKMNWFHDYLNCIDDTAFNYSKTVPNKKMSNQVVSISLWSNGQYAIRILPEKLYRFDVKHVEDNDSEKKKKSKFIKINTQFGHTFSTFNNLKSLLKDSGCLNEVSKILNKLVAIFQDLKLGYPKQLVLIRSNGFTLH